jgi:hypothetical protein
MKMMFGFSALPPAKTFIAVAASKPATTVLSFVFMSNDSFVSCNRFLLEIQSYEINLTRQRKMKEECWRKECELCFSIISDADSR